MNHEMLTYLSQHWTPFQHLLQLKHKGHHLFRVKGNSLKIRFSSQILFLMRVIYKTWMFTFVLVRQMDQLNSLPFRPSFINIF